MIDYCRYSTFVVDVNTLFETISALLCWFNPFGKVTEVSPVQSLNAPHAMMINPSGKVTEVSPLHPLNVCCPMLVNPSGKVTEVSPEHF